MYAAIPLYVGALANWIGGTIVDAIYRRGPWKLSRRLPAMFGFALAAVCVVAIASITSVNSFILCFSLATFGVDLTLSPSWTACADIGGRYTGTLGTDSEGSVLFERRSQASAIVSEIGCAIRRHATLRRIPNERH